MPTITTVRDFNGSSDELQMHPALTQAPTAITIAAIVKPDVDTAGNRTIWGRDAAGGAAGDISLFRKADQLAFYNGIAAEVVSPTGYSTAAMGWQLLAVTKATGTVTSRWHRYRYDTLAWDHQNDDATYASPGTATTPTVWIGTFDGAIEFWDGLIACVGVWMSKELTDAEIEKLPGSLGEWLRLKPSGLWLLDQAAVTTAVTDLTPGGTASEIARSGTTATADSTLPFDVGPPGVIEDRSQFPRALLRSPVSVRY